MKFNYFQTSHEKTSYVITTWKQIKKNDKLQSTLLKFGVY